MSISADVVPSEDVDLLASVQPRSLFKQTLKRLLSQPGGVVGLTLVLSLMSLGVFAPVLARHDPLEINADFVLAKPSTVYWFGTDDLGRDILSRVLFGARISITVAFLSAVAALLVAVPVGLVAGYFGGSLDAIISRCLDTLFAFPSILTGLGIAAVLGASVMNVVLALAIVNLPTLGRLTRVSVMAQKAQDYIEAARAIGASDVRIIARHILPNTIPVLAVQSTIVMAEAVLLEAAFSFLGLGTRPPTPSWGIMLSEGRNFLSQAPWMSVFAGIFVTLLVLGFNSLGDALRNALNPRWTK